jgi:putative spermidine/putrescine transport system substrate-binding protein
MFRHLKGAVALSVLGFGSAAFAQDLVIAATGGAFEDVLKEAYITPFQKVTGLDVAIASQDSTVGPLKAQVEAGNVKWDVVYLAPIDSEIAKADGLIQPIDYSVVDSEGLREGAAKPERLAALYSATVVAWNSTGLQDIAGPEAVFDLETYPGKRAIRSSTPYGVLEIALMADGVSKKDLYPLDLDRAFNKLDEIKDEIIFYTANEQGVQLLASGQAQIGIIPNGRAFKASVDGLDIDYTFNGGVNFVDYWVVPKGAKNSENAMKFLDFISKADGQKVVGDMMAYGSNNPAADATYSIEHQKHMPTFPDNANGLVTMDSDWWSQNLKSVFSRWQSWTLN